MARFILKTPLSALLISRYILRLGQAAQKQQRPRCPNRKMYLEIRRADEWPLLVLVDVLLLEKLCDVNNMKKVMLNDLCYENMR